MNEQKKVDIDLIFTETSFYRKSKHFYSQMESFKVPDEISTKIIAESIYPIQFGPQSPLFLAKIIQTNIMNEQNIGCVRCQMYLRQFEYPKIQPKSIVGETQLLLSSKLLYIPITIFVYMILATRYKQWEEAIEINQDTNIRRCQLYLMSLSDYVNYVSFRKAKRQSIPFRRLPGVLSIPRFDKLDTRLLTNDMSFEELIKLEIIICFSKNHFNLNSSLSYVRIPSSLNGGTKMDDGTKIEQIRDNNIISENNQIRKTKRKRGRPSFKKEAKDEPHIDTRIESTVPLPIEQSERPSKKHHQPVTSRNLRKRKREGENQLNETRRVKKENSGKYKDDSDDAGDTIRQTSRDSEVESVAPRRSSRKLNNPTIKDDPQNIVADNESYLDRSSESNSAGTKKVKRVSTFKKKAAQILKRWVDENEFKTQYFDFYQNLHNHLPRIPKMGWIEVNVYKLFKLTIQRGGFREVTRKLLWKDVYKSLNNTTIVSNAATTIRSHYKKLLLDFEISLFSNQSSTPTPERFQPIDNLPLTYPDQNGMETMGADRQNEYIQVQKSSPYKEFLIDNILNNKHHDESPNSSRQIPSNAYSKSPYDPKYNESMNRANSHMLPYEHNQFCSYVPPPVDFHQPRHYCNYQPNPHQCIDKEAHSSYPPDPYNRPYPYNWEHDPKRPYNGYCGYHAPPVNPSFTSPSWSNHHPHSPPPYDNNHYGYNHYFPHFMGQAYHHRYPQVYYHPNSPQAHNYMPPPPPQK